MNSTFYKVSPKDNKLFYNTDNRAITLTLPLIKKAKNTVSFHRPKRQWISVNNLSTTIALHRMPNDKIPKASVETEIVEYLETIKEIRVV